MGTKVRKIAIIIFFILGLIAFIFSLSSCMTQGHIYRNPCTEGEYYDPMECEFFKKNFPKDYEKYREKLERDGYFNEPKTRY